MGVYIFDTETTARDDGEIIEAALIRLPTVQDLAAESDAIPERLHDGEYWERRYRPSKPITFGSMAVHHILPSELADCSPSSAFSLPKDATYLIGHSIDFDWKAAGSPPDVKRICTHAIAQHLWPDADSHSLAALLYMLCGPTPETREMLRNAHSALTDATNTLVLLEKILAAKPEIRTWSALWEFSEQCREPLVLPFTRHRGTPICELDEGLIYWCLDLQDLDPYLRKALEKELKRRESLSARTADDDDFDDPY